MVYERKGSMGVHGIQRQYRELDSLHLLQRVRRMDAVPHPTPPHLQLTLCHSLLHHIPILLHRYATLSTSTLPYSYSTLLSNKPNFNLRPHRTQQFTTSILPHSSTSTPTPGDEHSSLSHVESRSTFPCPFTCDSLAYDDGISQKRTIR